MKSTLKTTKKRYYFAYGSNCNIDQMAVRCPKAAACGSVTLRNYTLMFNGVASIRRRNGSKVMGVLWEITPDCERSLDRYEGYPRLYVKQNVTVFAADGSSCRAMVYVMAKEYNRPALPTDCYYNGIREGFRQNNIPAETLEAALNETYANLEYAI